MLLVSLAVFILGLKIGFIFFYISRSQLIPSNHGCCFIYTMPNFLAPSLYSGFLARRPDNKATDYGLKYFSHLGSRFLIA